MQPVCSLYVVPSQNHARITRSGGRWRWRTINLATMLLNPSSIVFTCRASQFSDGLCGGLCALESVIFLRQYPE